MRIAIDAMGGDHAPQSTVDGALAAAREWSDTEIVLVGKEQVLKPMLEGAPANLRIHPAEEIIEAEDEPVKAVRRKKDASMVVAGRLVREGEADAMISAGNTGALMTTGLLVVGRMEGIERPALAPMIPTVDERGVLALDLGANMDAKPEHLAQYALMGSVYREKVHGIAKPRVGLLNVGTEAMKGNELTKAAYPLLKEPAGQFCRQCGSPRYFDRCLRCAGVRRVCRQYFAQIAGRHGGHAVFDFKAGIYEIMEKQAGRGGADAVAARAEADARLQGARGAPLLGLGGLVVKGHGSSDGGAIKNAVRQARLALQNKLTESIAREISGK